MNRSNVENIVMKNRYKFVMQKFESCADDIITPELASRAVFPRRRNIHKGDCGRLLLLAGSPGLTGAAIMASQSALKTGSGLVTLLCAKELNTIFEIRLTEVMTIPLNSENGIIKYENYEKINSHMQISNAFLIGPGLSQSNETQKIINSIIKDCKSTLIIDADGINAVAKNPEILSEANCPIILTPHIGEFARLVKTDINSILNNKDELCLDFAKRYNVFVALKSHQTIVCSPDGELKRNILGNPGMATGGSGDVLSGIIASLVSQGNNPFTAVCSGVFLHSAAADMAELEYGTYSLTPTDIINTLPYAIKETSENNF